MGETEDFEWDDAKEAANLHKHGLSLLAGALLFADPLRLEHQTIISGELRFRVVGAVLGQILACVYVWRNGKRRLISVRRASRQERKAYAKIAK